jgi:predicted RNase H-like HicB family nuclease
MTVAIQVDPSVLQYRVEIRPEAAADGSIVYMAEIPDLPGCMSHGRTTEEARQSLEDAKREYIAALQERGLPVPAPTPDPAVGAITWTVSIASTGQIVLGPEQPGSLRLVSRTDALEPA